MCEYISCTLHFFPTASQGNCTFVCNSSSYITPKYYHNNNTIKIFCTVTFLLLLSTFSSVMYLDVYFNILFLLFILKCNILIFICNHSNGYLKLSTVNLHYSLESFGAFIIPKMSQCKKILIDLNIINFFLNLGVKYKTDKFGDSPKMLIPKIC